MSEYALEKILVCLQMDDSDGSVIAAAGQVARLARAREVIFAHAEEVGKIPDELAEKYEGLRSEAESTRARMVEAVEGSLHGPDGMSVRYEFRTGHAVRELTELAAVEDVDLIMVAQPRTVADMPYAGSRLAVRLASKCHCSLASIPAGRELKFDRALAPIRNSECSRRALQSAIDLASAAGDEFEIIAHYVYPIAAGYARVGLSYEEFGEALQGCAEQEYRKLMETVDVGSARITPVFTGDTEVNPARHIAQEIVERDVDVVFIGSRGRTGPAGIILGHVTEALIMSSPAPVVAIKEKGENIGLLKALGIIM